MNNKGFQLLLCFIFLSTSFLFSQPTTLVSKNNIVPPSPTASSLGKYAEWPVSLYNGTPQISLPLHTLSAKKLSVPISLSYHASGNRVDDYASWVGLGWSLNSGGVITRTVRGLPDDQSSHGYFQTRALLRNPDLGYQNMANYAVYFNQAIGILDSQPDVFMFNAMGQSFKFFIDSNFNIQSIPKNAVKITLPQDVYSVFSGNEQWIAQLEDGTKLFFGGTGATERTENFSNYTNDGYYSGTGFASSWFLKKVVSVTGEEVNFYYDQENYTTKNALSSTDYKRFAFAAFRPEEINESTSKIAGVRLSRMQSANELIKFIPRSTSRTDLPFTYALDSIKVYSIPSQTLIKQLRLNYKDVGSSFRLTLDHVNEFTPDNMETKNQWGFEYSETKLPLRGSYAQDHWGFYNGANDNRTFLPYVEGLDVNQLIGDREAHFPFSSAEILTQINYPTGGGSKFNYEPHSYIENSVEGGIAYASATLLTSDPIGTEKTISFNKNSVSEATLEYSLVRDPNENDPVYVIIMIKNTDNGSVITKVPSVNGSYKELLNLDAGNYTLSIRSPDMGNTYCTANLSWISKTEPHAVNRLVGGVRIRDIVDFDGNTVLGKKKYVYESPYCASPITNTDYSYLMRVLVIDPCVPVPGEPSVNMVNSYLTRTSYSRSIMGTTGGGAIGYGKVSILYGDNGKNGSEENHFSNSPEDQIKRFFPFPPATSFDYKRGLLLNQKIKDASGKMRKDIINTYDFIPNYIQSGYAIGFSLFNPCATSGSGSIYQTLITHGSYHNYSEWIQKINQKEDIYDDAGNISSTSTAYYYDNPAHLQVTRTVSTNSAGKVITSLSTFPDDYASGTAFLDQMKANHQIALPIEQVSYQTDQSGIKILGGKITEYLDEGKALPYKVYQLETKNPIPLSLFKFSGRALGQLTFGTPLSSYQKDATYSEKLKYQYDGLGNVLMVTPKYGVSSSYKWGYNQNYPIAECTNASDSEFYYEGFEDMAGATSGIGHTGSKYTMGSGVNWTRPNNRNYTISYWFRNAGIWKFQSGQPYFSNSFTLIGGDAYDDICIYPSDAEIKTYTYLPLIGMTSATDQKGQTVYYEYDKFQRVKDIKDQHRYIIKNYQYSYRSAGGSFRNDAMSRVFVKSCPVGYEGPSVQYLIPEGKYTSFISQAAANQLAIDDLNANGQNNANLNGGECISTCNGVNQKMINNNCETGVRVNVSSEFVGQGSYRCTFYYRFSDGSKTADLTEYNSADCAVD